ncbi:MAG TPA: hypothetical protein VMF11_15330 [Candidatus Baltobacteraceae bacterium]|nr:hypothetical protein [Candidatus Baltobacteraceae bacterium]
MIGASNVFERYIGIDYSGAQTPTSSLKGLRVYQASRGSVTAEVPPPPSPRKHWTRKGVAECLVSSLRECNPTFVGIDHAFSFPLKYFAKHGLQHDWSAFLDDFQMHWPTDGDHMYVDFVRHDLWGAGALRSGNSRWRRITEIRTRTAKSVFHFDCQGTVAKSTHAGLPWLRFIRQQLGGKVFFWPFDGWRPPEGASVIAEVYPALWNKAFDQGDRSGDQHDAFVIAEWARQQDEVSLLEPLFTPPLSKDDMAAAEVEGWIFGLR